MENQNVAVITKSKNTKTGFTLVELVVVIAILAILAAIAIPMVINIVGNATESTGESNASTFRNSCSTFYAGVVSGEINSANFTPAAGSTMTVPAPNATPTVRSAGARSATVDDVLKYSKMDKTILNDLKYATVTTSNYKIGEIIYMPKNLANTASITTNLKLSKLYI